MPKLKSLPWKVAPKPDQIIEVGDPEYGVLELPKKNSLTINEAHFIRENTKDYPDIQTQAIQLAKEIAKEENIDFIEAFESLSSGSKSINLVATKAAKVGDTKLFVSAKEPIKKGAVVRFDGGAIAVLKSDLEINSEYAEVEPLTEAIANFEIGFVSVGSKIPQKYMVELMDFQRQSVEVAPLRNAVLATAMIRRIAGSEWTIDQTSEELPVPVINALAEFCSKEMNGWDEETPEPEPVTEESLKND